ncbi:S8 family serine peptidase [Pseudomonas aeruginosa]|nr:S8 family serine peptidase [Pseudomonas aeruginosa]
MTYTYADQSGTSYATPLVSASAALLAERFPTWTWRRCG